MSLAASRQRSTEESSSACDGHEGGNLAPVSTHVLRPHDSESIPPIHAKHVALGALPCASRHHSSPPPAPLGGVDLLLTPQVLPQPAAQASDPSPRSPVIR
jgi:hypothetical protein